MGIGHKYFIYLLWIPNEKVNHEKEKLKLGTQ